MGIKGGDMEGNEKEGGGGGGGGSMHSHKAIMVYDKLMKTFNLIR